MVLILSAEAATNFNNAQTNAPGVGGFDEKHIPADKLVITSRSAEKKTTPVPKQRRRVSSGKPGERLR